MKTMKAFLILQVVVASVAVASVAIKRHRRQPEKTFESVCAKHPWFKCHAEPDRTEKHPGLYIHLHGLTVDEYDRVLTAVDRP